MSCGSKIVSIVSDIHSHSYSRFKSGVPTQEDTSLTYSARPVYTFSFSLLC